jgi:hypothetical protein
VTITSVDEMVEEYLRRLNTALGPLPDPRRHQLVTEITEHIEQARSELPEQSEAAVRNLLDRLGRPEDIAAAALADDQLPGDQRSSRKLIISLIVGAALVAAALTALVALRGTPNPGRTTARSMATTTTTRTTPVAPPATVAPVVNPLDSGTYANGGQGTPHYYVSVTGTSAGRLIGSVNFLYQDGQSSVVFTFDGTSENGSATLQPTGIPQNGSASQNPASVPAAISATYGQGAVDLGECTSYLHFVQAMAQCSFTLSPQGP